MSPPQLPLELFLVVARSLIGEHGECCYADLNSLLQVNRALYDLLNPMLWREATEHEATIQRTLTHLLKTKNLARLKFFLELGADVETVLPRFRMDHGEYEDPSALVAAAYLNNIPLARLLLEYGAKVNYEEPRYSALHAARSAEMVQLLLDHHADINRRDRFEYRPLHRYAMRDNIAAMRVALQHGVDVNPLGQLGHTPLHEVRSADAAMLLLEFGAVIQKQDSSGNTLLHLAAVAGRTEVVKLLLERWPEGARERDRRQNTPLHWAAAGGQREAARLLLECWSEGMQAETEYGETPLHYAARQGRIEVMKLFLERWPEGVRKKNKQGCTPLHSAAAKGYTDAVRLLVDCWPEGKEELNKAEMTAINI
jgi:ankyrin repeat protein